MSKKKILIIIFLIIITALTSFLGWYFVAKYPEIKAFTKLKEISQRESLIAPSALDSCEATSFCINLFVSEIINNLTQRLNNYSIENKNYYKEIKELESLATEKKYREMINSLESILRAVNIEVSKKANSNIPFGEIKNNIVKTISTNIGGDYYRVGSFFSEKNYYLIQLIPVNELTDPGFVFYKVENNNWQIIDGPGTDFEAEELRNKGVPNSLVSKVGKIPQEKTIQYAPQKPDDFKDYLE